MYDEQIWFEDPQEDLIQARRPHHDAKKVEISP